ncbi:hypothetical protein AWC17_23815 [Mycobacterium nebraskense]|uniref:Uncharacterized protein n=1 Tax=Mycobacterium nebraskense TaxID=244292 RepID=A0A1X2A0I7_9MYCO|nr:hypothetical protein WU83_23690 [Mycobacterium nebraskense]ORW34493.1 hypothetical protein AWC17_23815 [Mycobacterium nebraskense]
MQLLATDRFGSSTAAIPLRRAGESARFDELFERLWRYDMCLILESMIVRCVAKGVALLAVCVPAVGAPEAALADTVDPNHLASVQSWPDNTCGGFFSWHVINDLKDASIRATVAVQRNKGTEEFDDRYVYNLAPGTSSFVSCKRITATDGPTSYDVTAWLVGAEKA